jgi:hypothetical protein
MPLAPLDSMRRVVASGLVLFIFVSYAQAQIDRASLTGTFTDASGAVIPGVKIDAVAVDTQLHYETMTNKQGTYRLTALPVGNYVVTVTVKGFESVEIKDIKLQVGETRTLNLQLKVGAIRETIEVMSTTDPLQQTLAEVGSVIQGEQIANLPANGRNWASMLLLAAGAIDDGGGDQRTIRFAGRARDDNNFTMDGVDSCAHLMERESTPSSSIFRRKALPGRHWSRWTRRSSNLSFGPQQPKSKQVSIPRR